MCELCKIMSAAQALHNKKVSGKDLSNPEERLKANGFKVVSTPTDQAEQAEVQDLIAALASGNVQGMDEFKQAVAEGKAPHTGLMSVERGEDGKFHITSAEGLDVSTPDGVKDLLRDIFNTTPPEQEQGSDTSPEGDWTHLVLEDQEEQVREENVRNAVLEADLASNVARIAAADAIAETLASQEFARLPVESRLAALSRILSVLQ